jgi:predicted metal-dependent phosphoesterase TrpH
VHSRASDGALAPREVVRLASEMGLRAVAVTDHDTVAGVPDALAAGEEFGIEVIPAVEISTEFADGACHILGYFIDLEDAALGALLAEAREGRERRNVQMLEKLAALGMPLAMDDVRRHVTAGVVTRAHFASALIEKGYVASWDEAFEKFLGRDKAAYVYRKRLNPFEAVRAVRGAGGLASLAHPRQLNRSVEETEKWIADLARAGLDAVETQSPDHNASLARQYKAIAERLGLLETGGTDWHGHEHNTGFSMGVGRGAIRVRYAVVEKMKDRLASRAG